MEAKYQVLIRYLRNNFPECVIHLIYEAGFKGFTLCDQLASDEIDCVIISPQQVTEPKVSRVKTDKRDANRLDLILEDRDFKDACHVPNKERMEDRQINQTLIGIQKDVVRTRNRIHKLIDFHGIKVPNSRWGRADFRILATLSLPEPLRISLDILLDELEHLSVYRTTLRTSLHRLCQKERYHKLWEIARSLPGIKCLPLTS